MVLEGQLEKWAGVENMAVCSSGTAALHLALEALRLPRGTRVIMPDFAMIACARAVSLAGLIPTLVDCGPDLNMDMSLLEEAYSPYAMGDPIKKLPKASAIMLVHTYGRVCDRKAAYEFAKANNLYVIEDWAEAHGATWQRDLVPDAMCWSFYRNKIIYGEEGGAVAFPKDKSACEIAKSLRNLGFTPLHDFNHLPRGHNYRLSNAHAELILHSLYEHTRKQNLGDSPRKVSYTDLRSLILNWYDASCPPAWRMPVRDVPWVYDLRIPGMKGYTQDLIIHELNSCKSLGLGSIMARHSFKPISSQLEYRDCKAVWYGALEHRAAIAANEVIYLPILPRALRSGDFLQEDVPKIFSKIRTLLESHK